MPESPAPRIRLRDVTLADADLLDELHRRQQAEGGFNSFGLPPTPVDREVLATGPLRNEHNGTFLVERIADREVVGTVSWHAERYGPNVESTAWNIGIELVPEARGRGYGGEAQRQLADWLFANSPYHRVEASTDVENIAEQRALEKAGFLRDGTMRGSQFRAGTWHDIVVYGRLRDDPR